jgi:hypothetical protein
MEYHIEVIARAVTMLACLAVGRTAFELMMLFKPK